MTQLSIIVAIDRQRGIGLRNQLPWHLPEDLAHFKRLTTGHPIIMGRKTFDSIGRPLPNRRSIVITRDGAWQREGVDVVHSLDEAVALVGDAPAFIIGGAQVFDAALAVADRLIVTEIDGQFACDTFFPAIDPATWHAAERTRHQSASGPAFDIVIYTRNQAAH
jgi:dihydrofolate reductase